MRRQNAIRGARTVGVLGAANATIGGLVTELHYRTWVDSGLANTIRIACFSAVAERIVVTVLVIETIHTRCVGFTAKLPRTSISPHLTATVGVACFGTVAERSIVAVFVGRAGWQWSTCGDFAMPADTLIAEVVGTRITIGAVGVSHAGQFAAIGVLVADLACVARGRPLLAHALLGAGFLPVAEFAVAAIVVG